MQNFEPTHPKITREIDSSWYPDGRDEPAKIKYSLESNRNGHFIYATDYPTDTVRFATRVLAEDAYNLLCEKELTLWANGSDSKLCASSDEICISRLKRTEWKTISEVLNA